MMWLDVGHIQDRAGRYAGVVEQPLPPLMLVVNPGLPVQNVKELIAFAKAKPNQLNYASFGNGSIAHLAGELLKTSAGYHHDTRGIQGRATVDQRCRRRPSSSDIRAETDKYSKVVKAAGVKVE